MRKAAFLTCLFVLFGMLCGCSVHSRRLQEYFPDPRVRALVRAVEKEDVKEIDRLVTQGINVNARGKDGMTPLIWAIYHLKKASYRALLEHGADPNLQIQSGRHAGGSVMQAAAGLSDSFYLKLALEHGGNPNLVNPYSSYKRTPLFSAIDPFNPHVKENVDMLIKSGANLNTDFNGVTPLMSAVASGRYDIVYLLLQAGADFHLEQKSLVAYIQIRNDDPNNIMTTVWKKKVIEFLNAHGVEVHIKPHTPMCLQHLGNGVNVTAPCEQLKRHRSDPQH